MLFKHSIEAGAFCVKCSSADSRKSEAEQKPAVDRAGPLGPLRNSTVTQLL